MRQNTRDGVQDVLARHPPSEWSPDHSAEKLGDVSPVLCRTVRDEHLRTRAIPARGDGVLREENADVLSILHGLRAYVGNRVASDLEVRVLAEDMRQCVLLQFRPSLPNGTKSRQEQVVRGPVRNLYDK